MFTLAEWSKIEEDPLRKSIIDTLLMEANLLELVPWETIGALSTGVIRIQDLPSLEYRRLNGAYTGTDIGHLEDDYERVCLFGRDIDTDEAIARAKGIVPARTIQQLLSVKAMAYEFNWGFIENKVDATTPLVYNGLKKRIDDLYTAGFTGQKIDCGCGGVGVLNSAATQNAFIDKLDELIYATKGHQPDYLLMNGKTLRIIRSALRRLGLLDTTKDMFGRNIDVYSGCRMIDVGVKADQTTDIITITESSTGAARTGGECTSIYAVKLSIGDMTWGIQEFPMEAVDLTPGKETLQEKPAYRTRITWNFGLCTVDPKSLARLYNVIPDASS